MSDLSVSPSLGQSPSQNQSPIPRGHYTIYTPEQKAAIAKYAVEKNLKEACDKFSEEYGIKVKESTARQFKKAYFDELNQGKRPEEIKALRGKRRGRPARNRRNSLSVMTPTTPNDAPNAPAPILTEMATFKSEDNPASFSNDEHISFTMDTPITMVTTMSSDEMDEKVTGSVYGLGEMVIPTCVSEGACISIPYTIFPEALVTPRILPSFKKKKL